MVPKTTAPSQLYRAARDLGTSRPSRTTALRSSSSPTTRERLASVWHGLEWVRSEE